MVRGWLPVGCHNRPAAKAAKAASVRLGSTDGIRYGGFMLLSLDCRGDFAVLR